MSIDEQTRDERRRRMRGLAVETRALVKEAADRRAERLADAIASAAPEPMLDPAAARRRLEEN